VNRVREVNDRVLQSGELHGSRMNPSSHFVKYIIAITNHRKTGGRGYPLKSPG
jgi:hypothetical protein